MTRSTRLGATLALLTTVFAAPAAAQPLFPSAEVPIRLVGEPGLTLHVLEGMSSAVAYGNDGSMAVAYGYNYRTLCAAPCETTLPRGAHALALSASPGDAPVPVGTYVLDSPMQLAASYRSRAAIRLAGWLTWIVGVLGGGSLVIASLFTGPEQCDDYSCSRGLDVPLMVTGAAIAGAGMIAGLIMTNFHDVALLEPVQ